MGRSIDMVVLSDTHLGTHGCHAKELLNYLNSIEVETLVLNGDFIDMSQFKKSFFPKEHIRVIRRILNMAEQGTKVYYITGNHDDALRPYTDFSMGNLHLRQQLTLQLNGKRYWLFHGDIFDLSVRYSPIIAKLGSTGYDYLIVLNRWVNKLRNRIGMKQISLAKFIKKSVKSNVNLVSDFEQKAIDMAMKKGVDYVVCGHIHRPQMRAFEKDGKQVIYLNSGDWVENLTTLEYNWGRWTIYQYEQADYDYVSPRLRVASSKQEELTSLDPSTVWKELEKKKAFR